MIRKISFLLLSIGIVVVGYIAFSELSYWERSVRIFKYEPDTAFQGRGGRGHEGRSKFRGRSGFERPGGRDQGIRELPGRGGDRHGRGGLPDGRKMNLRNVYWFLAVFSSFTVVVIYLDKAICLMKKKQVNN